jgi:hypothetical protein
LTRRITVLTGKIAVNPAALVGHAKTTFAPERVMASASPSITTIMAVFSFG